MRLLTVENAKTSKGVKQGYLTGILYLAPHRIASTETLCPHSTPGCRAACLFSAGRGRFDSINEARRLKTIHFENNFEGFIEQLSQDIYALKAKASRLGLRAAVRLNGTSDVCWERVAPKLFETHSDVQFYEYTKFPLHERPSQDLPKNLHLTYSFSEAKFSMLYAVSALTNGRNVAVVFENELPETYLGVRVISGDDDDLRFLDPRGVVIGLRAKAKAKQDATGFVAKGL